MYRNDNTVPTYATFSSFATRLVSRVGVVYGLVRNPIGLSRLQVRMRVNLALGPERAKRLPRRRRLNETFWLDHGGLYSPSGFLLCTNKPTVGMWHRPTDNSECRSLLAVLTRHALFPAALSCYSEFVKPRYLPEKDIDVFLSSPGSPPPHLICMCLLFRFHSLITGTYRPFYCHVHK